MTDFSNGVRVLKTFDVLNATIEGMSGNDRTRILADRRALNTRYCMQDHDGRWTTLLEGDRVFGPGSSRPFFEVGPNREAIGRMSVALETVRYG